MRDSVFNGAFGLRKLITAVINGVVVTGAMLLGLTGTASAYTVTVTPESQSANVGSQVSVSIFASDFNSRGLGSYNLDLTFQSGVLGFNSVTDGLGMVDAFGLMWGLIDDGRLTFTDTSLADPVVLLAQQSPNVALFTIVFDALAEGTSFLTLSGVTLADAWGSSEMSLDLFHGSVTVSQVTTPVPEPGVWALMLLGAVLVAWMKRRDAAGRTRMSGLDSLALRG